MVDDYAHEAAEQELHVAEGCKSPVRPANFEHTDSTHGDFDRPPLCHGCGTSDSANISTIDNKVSVPSSTNSTQMDVCHSKRLVKSENDAADPGCENSGFPRAPSSNTNSLTVNSDGIHANEQCVTECSSNESSCVPDDKIGFICTHLAIEGYGESDDSLSSSRSTPPPLATELRYVYRSRQLDERLYYLTRSKNKVLVVDTKCVEFFPDGVEPPELRGQIKDYAFEEPLQLMHSCCREDEEVLELEPDRVGWTYVQVPRINPFTKEVKFKKARRDVFVSVGYSDYPYFTQVSGRRINVDARHVFFGVCDQESNAESEETGSDDDSVANAVPPLEDTKVGSVTIKVSAKDGGRNEKRDVYSSPHTLKGRPYYLTLSSNPILVMDDEKIEYNPGRKPASAFDVYLYEREQWRRKEEEDHMQKESKNMELERVKKLAEEYGEVLKVGYILLRAPRANGGLSSEKLRHNVYKNIKNQGEKPFYLSSIGNKIFISDDSRIHYLLPDGTEPEDVQTQDDTSSNVATQYLKELIKREEESLQRDDDEESVDLSVNGAGDHEKIGTIAVQKALHPGSRVTAAKEILDVYGTPMLKGKPDGKPKKPFMITKSGKRIYVMNRSAIRYIQPKEEELTLEKAT